ncbi:hypothetical protein [Vogesella indigofera]|uniref:hypothetical protein n=1 Tax=Vogesella indigofera TaxID=45465 RepID=UPI00234F814F|nr:hypothetical protein [Vogesella indigofera]MDC7701678.1 hypothetical protein [Vogesella indigofera]
MVILFAPLTYLVLSLMTVGIGHSLSTTKDEPVSQAQHSDHQSNTTASENEFTP